MRNGTGNKGEWSEVYAALSIWRERQIVGSTRELKRDNEKRWAINTVAVPGHLPGIEFHVKGNELLVKKPCTSLIWSDKDAQTEIKELLKRICEAHATTFSIQKSSKLYELLEASLHEASSGKSDLVVSVYDSFLEKFIPHGFNIKSQLGARSSLLNASKRTNFQFKLIPAIAGDAKEFQPRSCMPEKVSRSGLEWTSMDKQFKENLELIDSNLPRVLSWLLIWYYQYGENCSFAEAAAHLQKLNPLNVENPSSYYSIKLQEFLIACGLGLSPSKKWEGKYEANGGYVIVKKDGVIVTFYVVDGELKGRLGQYLLANCFLDTPSTTRHEFGDILREEPGDASFINLNLQIRLH
jgi:type II restriction enzyme